MNLDTHFELRQSGFSTETLSWFYSMRLPYLFVGAANRRRFTLS
jgi:hypothetical protein